MRPQCVIPLVAAVAAGNGALHPAHAGENDLPLCARVAWQIALERVGLSPGVIDGTIGSKTRLATREFQRVQGLPMTGGLDSRTAEALGVDPDAALGTYTVQPEDFHDIGPVPEGWEARSKLRRLGYESLTSALAEKFHCSRALLRQLNPKRDLDRLVAGDVVVVPAVPQRPPAPRGELLHVDLNNKVIRVLNRQQQIVGLFHCSVAAKKAKRPSGEAAVVGITPNPTYTFDPKMWPEVKNVTRKLLIPPGPRNPVGLCWIGLNLPGYGIHGTPHPELIGKTGSHGCFRLTNWDALRLAQMVRVGTRVRFTG
ncbi:MAG: murein L,D-transpeptidase [Planctomycetes bacterium]|nr:murein L,D-transpeptidase [Planctomycetota bacterium]